MDNSFSRRIAVLFSALFNPLFIPLIGMAWILYADQSVHLEIMHPKLKQYLLYVTLIFSTLLPLITLILMKTFGLTMSLELPYRRDRRLPILLSAAYSLFGYLFVRQIPQLNPLFQLLPLGSFCVLLTAYFFTLRFQISLHLMALGGLTGTFTLASRFLGTDYLTPVSISICLAALTAFARIRLNAHKPYQVYSGYLSGFLIHYLSVTLLFRWLY
jgi:membrane-associated phospholipid phosphatase